MSCNLFKRRKKFWIGCKITDFAIKICRSSCLMKIILTSMVKLPCNNFLARWFFCTDTNGTKKRADTLFQPTLRRCRKSCARFFLRNWNFWGLKILAGNFPNQKSRFVGRKVADIFIAVSASPKRRAEIYLRCPRWKMLRRIWRLSLSIFAQWSKKIPTWWTAWFNERLREFTPSSKIIRKR